MDELRPDSAAHLKDQRRRLAPTEIESWARQYGVRMRPGEFFLLTALDRLRCRPKSARNLRSFADINDPAAVKRALSNLGRVKTVDRHGNPVKPAKPKQIPPSK